MTPERAYFALEARKMKEVIQETVRQLQDQQPCVLATVVRTKGSTPQKAGSMLLVRQDGTGVGTLGGGCVEGDIWYAAREMLRNHSGPEFKDYFLNEDIAARDGLVCGGTMYFYLEPMWEPDSFMDIGSRVINAYEGGDPVGLATVVNVPEGNTNLGAKLLAPAGRHGGRYPGKPGTGRPGCRSCSTGCRCGFGGELFH